MVGKAAPLRGHLGGARAPDEGEGEVAQGRHDLRSVSTAQAGAIFTEGHIADPMPTFNAPMSPNPGEEDLRCGVGRRLVGAKVVHLLMGAPAVAHAAGQTGHRGERGFSGGDAQDALLSPSPTAIEGADLPGRGAGIRKGEGQVPAQGGVIVLDAEHVAPAVVHNLEHWRSVTLIP
jgi:hypothetical protein